MRLPAVLLRMLLCLCLVLDGTAAATASVRMASMADGKGFAGDTRASRPQASAAMPCHHADAKRMAASGHAHAPAVAVKSGAPEPKHPLRGCCGAPNCHCQCAMQAPVALLSDLPRFAPPGAQAPGIPALSLAHAPPARMPLMRPPIR